MELLEIKPADQDAFEYYPNHWHIEKGRSNTHGHIISAHSVKAIKSGPHQFYLHC